MHSLSDNSGPDHTAGTNLEGHMLQYMVPISYHSGHLSLPTLDREYDSYYQALVLTTKINELLFSVCIWATS